MQLCVLPFLVSAAIPCESVFYVRVAVHTEHSEVSLLSGYWILRRLQASSVIKKKPAVIRQGRVTNLF